MRAPSIVALGCLLVACSGESADRGPPDRGLEDDGGAVDMTAGPLPREVPQPAFTGRQGGCWDLFAYRASADGTQYVGVHVDRDVLDLAVGSKRVVDLGTTAGGVEVNVDVYASAPGGESYCAAAAPQGGRRMTRWTAEAGSLSIELAPDPSASSRDAPTYRATFRIEKAHFTGPERGFAVVVPQVVIEDVRVGWRPG